MLSRRSVALVSVVALMLVWGSTFAVTKAAIVEIPPLTLAALRFAVASVVLVPAAALRGGLRLLPRPLPLWPLLWMAFTGIGIYFPAFNYALLHASASQGALVFALLPATIAIAAAVTLGERPPPARVAGIVLSVAGVALLVATGAEDAHSHNPLLGALCMAGAVVAWTFYTIVAKRLAPYDTIVVIACVSVAGLAMLTPLAIWELGSVPWPRPSLGAWLGLAFLGVIASAVSYAMYGRALRDLEAGLVGALINLDPVVGVAVAVFALGETLHPRQLVGAGIVVLGVWISTARRFEPSPTPTN